MESLLDLEKSRQRERDIRLEAEALLKGLHGIAGALNQDELFRSLVEALRNVIVFEDAFILQLAGENDMTVLATTSDVVAESVWEPQSVFKRVLAGRPIASFDINQVPEWQSQPESIKTTISSALHIGLHGGGWDAILIITHSSIKHFGQSDVKKAKRFAPLASQALLTLELQQRIIQRDRFFKLSMDLMAIIDSRGNLKQHNDVWTSLLGYERNEVRGKGLLDFVHQDDIESVEAVLHFLKEREGKELIEVRFRKKQGGKLWFSCSLASYHDGELFYVVARDITDSILYRQRLAHDAGHDTLTGLRNRRSFLSSLQQEFDASLRNEECIFAVFFLDLNKFKSINDTLGHDVGDELLKAFAKVLESVVRGRDVVARLGGDEFTLLLTDLKSPENAISVAERIQKRCLVPIELKGNTINVSTSIGIAVSSTKFHDSDSLLNAADRAMYSAKSDKSVPYVMH